MNRTGYENEQKSTAKDEETVTEQLKQLVKTYTSAYYGGDVNTVAEIAVPLSDSEKSYCQILGNYFQGYTHGTFYNTNGVNDGEYIVCYVADVVPIQTEEVLPVMGYLYVETDEDGELYINNLYSSFGIEEGEDTEAWDDAKYNAMSEYAQTDEIVTAYQDWSDRYDEACNNATIAEILSQIYAE
jgi:hypothetical protein